MVAKYRNTAMLIWDSEGPENLEKAVSEGQSQADMIAEVVRKSIPLHFATRFRADRLRQKTSLVRLAEFSPHEILSKVSNEKREFKIGTKIYSVKMDSHRYWTFSRNATCVCCGLIGTRMILERSANQEHPHFNLYGEKNDELILMTKDHIVPVSMGGKNSLENYQTMCSICNRLKGSSQIDLDGLREIRKVYDSNLGDVPSKALHEMLEKKRKQLCDKESASKRIRLACHKGKQDFLFTKVDLSIYHDPETGIYFGMPLKDNIRDGYVLVDKIEARSKVVPAGSDARKVIILLQDGKKVFVYQGMLEYELAA